jgi:hypothetical protein
VLLSIAVALIYIHINSVEVFLFSHILASIFVSVIDDSYLDCGEVESHCSFDLHFFYGQRY